MNSNVYKCSEVLQCSNSSLKTPNKLFFYVPHNKTTRYKWLNLARQNPNATELKSHIHFCEDHFELPNDMVNYREGAYNLKSSVSQVCMKPGCIPIKIGCLPYRRKRASDNTERPLIQKKQRRMIFEEMDSEEKNGETYKNPVTCLLCLTGSSRTCDVLNTHLQTIFEEVTDIKVESESQICSICVIRLQLCHELHQMVVANGHCNGDSFDGPEIHHCSSGERQSCTTLVKEEVDDTCSEKVQKEELWSKYRSTNVCSRAADIRNIATESTPCISNQIEIDEVRLIDRTAAGTPTSVTSNILTDILTADRITTCRTAADKGKSDRKPADNTKAVRTTTDRTAAGRTIADRTDAQTEKDSQEDNCDLYGKIIANKLRKLSETEQTEIMYIIDGLLLRRRVIGRQTASAREHLKC